jgi:acyl homoserine lactone synthase
MTTTPDCINDGLLNFFEVTHQQLTTEYQDELYQLRKITFGDRLGWDVVCADGMESDEFDNPATRYILGVHDGHIICSVRFISLALPNMINRTFRACFGAVPLPAQGVEASRFFVDKTRSKQLPGQAFPVSYPLFLAMINWAQSQELKGIHTIVSRPMLVLLRRSGWNITVLQEAFLTERERIYLLFLPTGTEDQAQMARHLRPSAPFRVTDWPMTVSA